MATYILYVVCVFVLLTHFTPAKSLIPSAAFSSHRILSPSVYYLRGYSRGRKEGYGRVHEGPVSLAPTPPLTPPHNPRSARSRDETHWQAQVIRRNTFGALKSHRHPVVIHQCMCQNLSPPTLNLVCMSGSC